MDRWAQKDRLSTEFSEINLLDAASLALKRRMNVQFQRRFDIRVSQHFADALDICSGLYAARCKCMPQGVEAPVTDAATFQKHGKLVLAGTRICRLANLPGHNIGVSGHVSGDLPQQAQ